LPQWQGIKVKEFHPDTVAHLNPKFREFAHQEFVMIQAAYERLVSTISKNGPGSTRTGSNQASDRIFSTMRSMIADQLDVPASRVTLESTLADLGAGSLDGLEFLIAVEDKFKVNIEDHHAAGLGRLREVVEYVLARAAGSSAR
jgi:acyl carrier protein